MKPTIAVLTSTTRPTRAGLVFAEWFMDQVKDSPDATFELVDIAEQKLPFMNEAQSPASGVYEHAHTKAWSEKIARYDGYVIVTAEYNNGYPAPLKNALDMLYHEWAKKPVAFVGYGTVGAARAVEHLVNTTAKLHMVPLSGNVVHIIEPWNAVNEVGKVKPEFVKGNLENLLKNLVWWATLLQPARQKTAA